MTLRAIMQSWRRWLGPALVVAAGFLLRAAYYNESYLHPDEPITVEVVGHMRSSGDWDTNWAKADKLPVGLRYDQYNFSSHMYATFWFYRVVKWIPGLEAWRSLDNGFFVYRFFVALLASVVVWQTWWLARRIAGDVAGLAAGAFAAVVPLLVQDAHYVRPEAFVTTLTLAAVAMSWPRANYRAWRVFAAAGIVGVMVACKVSMLALVWLPMAPVIALRRGEGMSAQRIGVAMSCAAFGLVAGFALGAPGALLHPQAFWNGVHYLTKQYAGLHPPYSHLLEKPVGDILSAYFWTTLGAPALIAGAVGLGWLVARRRWIETLLVGGPVLLFVGYFCTRSVFFERNLSHVVPLFCVLAGVGVVATVNVLTRWRHSGEPLLTVAVVLLVIVRPAELTRRLVFIEFSGKRAAIRDALEENLRQSYPGKEWWIQEIMNFSPLDRMGIYFDGHKEPVILRFIDYHDEWSRRYGGDLPGRFRLEKIGELKSSFSDVSACTLHTYNSWTEHYYLVLGKHPP